jgi:hypothetical protein
VASHLDAKAMTRLARFVCALAFVAGAVAISGAAAASQHTLKPAPTVPDFGPNVKIFDPSMSTTEIKADVDAIAAEQVSNQFGTQRYALLFMPGTYGTAAAPLNFQVGYYTEVAGLGSLPSDVAVNGTIDVYNQCFGPGDCTALVNFWRSLSNLTINVAGKEGCQSGEFWATSQAAPMRRVHVNGFMTLMDYCTAPSFASGGFIADSRLSGTVVNGSQQQYLVRNSSLGTWTNGVWNQVFAGVENAPPQSFPNPPYTTLSTTPASREKPFLYLDANSRFRVFVPDARFNTSGTTWANGQTPGHSIPIEDFFIAKPTDSVKSINNALSRGKNLLFTPGVYDIDRTIKVKRADTIVLGLGMATLTAQNGVIPMRVANVKGVEIAGLIFDAGAKPSPALLLYGDLLDLNGRGKHDPNGSRDESDPGSLHDVFFRIGGPHVGKALTSLVVGRDNTILDHIWAWRADHGSGVGWTTNTADLGVVVTGDNVVATGLFAEHYQKYNVFWAGENGRTIMFQNEMPYDPPNQAAWQHDGVLGWAAYKVADWVQTHEGWGLGSYCFFNVDPTIHASRAFEVPVTPGVKLHDILSLSITNHGTIDHVVNDVGAPTPPDTTPVNIVSYP